MLCLGRGGLDRIDYFDDVFTDTFGNLDRDCRFAIQTGKAFGILEGSAHIADIAEPDDGIPVNNQRHVKNVGHAFKQAGHLDVEPSGAGIDRTGGDKRVGIAHQRYDIDAVQAIGLDLHRVDDKFDQFFAVTGKIGFENRRNSFD